MGGIFYLFRVAFGCLDFLTTLQGDDCFCANETVLYTDTEYIEVSEECQKCSTNTGSCAEADVKNCAGYYAPFTCGMEEQERFSLYCNDRYRCFIFNGTQPSLESSPHERLEQQDYSYFGCINYPHHAKVEWATPHTRSEIRSVGL